MTVREASMPVVQIDAVDRVADTISRHLDATQGDMLSQVRPSGTSEELFYTAPAGEFAHLYFITIANPTGSAVIASVQFANGGGSGDDRTIFRESVAANSCVTFPSMPTPYGFQFANASAEMHVKVDTADSVVFTAFGKEFPV